MPSNQTSNDYITRYKRQLLIPEIGAQGQARLANAHISIVGVGALGGPIALYLAAAGVGQLTIFDDDVVDLSNLQRQIQFTGEDVGKLKVDVLAARLKALNPNVAVDLHRDRFTEGQIISGNILIDASDNFETRFAINSTSLENKTPIVSGAVGRWDAQIGVFNTAHDAPCYRCWMSESSDIVMNCVDDGVIGPLCGMVGSIMALEAIKLCVGQPSALDGNILAISGLGLDIRRLKLAKDPDCTICINQA